MLSKKLKKPFFGGQRISLETAKQSVTDFINNHFVLLGEKDESVSLDGILSAINNLEFDGLMIDPYNELESTRPTNMSMTEFVGHNLIRLRRFGKLKNKIIFISAHPTKPKKDDDGKYRVAELYDIADSAHWRNKADFGISVFRNEDTHQTEIHIQKVRFRHYGELGMTTLLFDKMCGAFYENKEGEIVW